MVKSVLNPDSLDLTPHFSSFRGDISSKLQALRESFGAVPFEEVQQKVLELLRRGSWRGSKLWDFTMKNGDFPLNF